MTTHRQRRGRLLRHTGQNVLGEGAPLLLAVVAIPALVRSLGVERFGVLALAWVVVDYFGFVYLGLGQAATRLIAEHLGHGRSGEAVGVFRTSFRLQAALGAVGGLLLAGATPALVTRLFAAAPPLVHEAQQAFLVLTLALPLLTGASAYRSLLEAADRFDVANAVKAATGCLVPCASLVGALAGFGLPEIVSLQVAGAAATVLWYRRAARRALPWLASAGSPGAGILRSLASYAGWSTAMSAAAATVESLDRLLIGALVSFHAVGYYSPAHLLTSRLRILPKSLRLALFPKFSALGRAAGPPLDALFTDASRLMVLIVGPLAILLVMFARELLGVWLGPEFVQHSRLILQVLAIGFFLNALAWVPSTLLQAIGRPDVAAKIFLCELAPYAALAWAAIARFGIEGAAVAWAVRGAAEAVVFVTVAARQAALGPQSVWRGGVGVGFATAALLAGGVLLDRLAGIGLGPRAAVASVLLLALLISSRSWAADAARSLLGRARGWPWPRTKPVIP
jgi:O-antigen/teichoic acid export membrane protein